MSTLIEIQNLGFGYEVGSTVQTIKNLNLSIKKGEFIALVGANGSGKSTFIRHLNGLLLPSTGTVLIDGLDTRISANIPVIRRKVGMVFQNPDSQLFASVVEEDVAFGLENMGLPPGEIRNRVDRALARVGMLDYKSHPPRRLSGGQRQKVAIAGVLAMETECIVLDEPTSMLDPGGKREVLEAVRKLNRSAAITVLHVTHDMTEALEYNRVLVMAGGEFVFSGTPAELFNGQPVLDKWGLELPPVKELVKTLREYNLHLPGDINTPGELVDALCL